MQLVIIVKDKCKLRIKPFLLAWVLADWKNRDMLAHRCRLALLIKGKPEEKQFPSPL